jgi:hypothetical protein
MKKLKLSTKTQGNKKLGAKTKTPTPQKVNPKSIQQLIFEDVKNINKFNILVEEFILKLQNLDEKGIKDISEILLEIYDFFLTKNKTMISNDLKNFLQEKLNILMKVYLDVLNPSDDDEESENFYKIILKDMQRFFKFSEEGVIITTVDSLVDQFLLNEELVDSNLIKAFTSSFIKSKKNLELIFNALYTKLSQSQKTQLKSETLFNVYNYIISMGKINEEKLKFLYQNIIIIIVNSSSIPKDILTNLLSNLNKVIFDNLENPLIFSDYLINIYEKANDSEFEIKVLSLSGLFVLLTKYKLDYSNYYNMLYKTICMKHYDGSSVKTVFDSKNRNRLFKILELSLKSPTVAINVILSFIKRLARISLVTSANNIAIILGIIQNIIKSHPRAVLLLLRNKKKGKVAKVNYRNLDEKIKENSQFDWSKFGLAGAETEDESVINNDDDLRKEEMKESVLDEDWSFYAKYEQFDDEQLDASKTNAHMSCLWELYTLKNHFSFKIRGLVAKFEKNFLKAKEFDLNSISNLKEQDMLYDVTENAHFYITPAPVSEEILNNKISLII